MIQVAVRKDIPMRGGELKILGSYNTNKSFKWRDAYGKETAENLPIQKLSELRKHSRMYSWENIGMKIKTIEIYPQTYKNPPIMIKFNEMKE